MTEPSQQANTSRIDVHQHLVPDVFRSLLNSVGITGGAGEELAPWDEQTTLGVMDEHEIRTSVLSYVLSGIEIDVSTWKITHLCVILTNEVIETLGYKKPFFGIIQVDIPVETVKRIKDVVTLDKSIAEIKDIVEHRE